MLVCVTTKAFEQLSNYYLFQYMFPLLEKKKTNFCYIFEGNRWFTQLSCHLWHFQSISAFGYIANMRYFVS